MSGGRLLGQGVYGCVFDPPLICRGKKAPAGGWKTNRLGKLGVTNDALIELMAAEVFKNKPESKKYFLLPILETVCEKKPGEQPIIESEQKEKDLDNCKSLAKQGVNNMLHFEMEYGGKTLHTTMSNIQLRIQEFNFFKFMEDMLEIGAYLILNGYIHNDLHSSNIVLNKNYHPRLIDFGRSYYSPRIDKPTVDGFGAVYEPTLNQIAPESTARDGLFEKIPFNRIADDLFKSKIGFSNAEKLFGIDRDEQKAEFIKFWNNSKTAQTQDWVTFFKIYWPVADSWSIGTILSNILMKLSLSSRFVDDKQWKEKRPVIKEVITGLLKASPKQRLDCMEALSMYNPMNAVVISSAGRNWLDKKQEGRKAKV